MSAAQAFLGSKISLISKAAIRYEGVLYSFDQNESTVALAKVRSFGTEDRPVERPVPPRDEIYEYIIFRGSDIRDLHVCEPPKVEPLHPSQDPAIVKISQASAFNNLREGEAREQINQLHPGGMPVSPPQQVFDSSNFENPPNRMREGERRNLNPPQGASSGGQAFAKPPTQPTGPIQSPPVQYSQQIEQSSSVQRELFSGDAPQSFPSNNGEVRRRRNEDRPRRNDYDEKRGLYYDGERPPRRNYGEDRPPRRNYNEERPPRRNYGEDRPPRRNHDEERPRRNYDEEKQQRRNYDEERQQRRNYDEEGGRRGGRENHRGGREGNGRGGYRQTYSHGERQTYSHGEKRREEDYYLEFTRGGSAGGYRSGRGFGNGGYRDGGDMRGYRGGGEFMSRRGNGGYGDGRQPRGDHHGGGGYGDSRQPRGGGGYYRRGRGRGPSGIPRGSANPTATFTEDYDFETANAEIAAELEKMTLNHKRSQPTSEEEGTSADTSDGELEEGEVREKKQESGAGDTSITYDSKKSFFDLLSSEASDRAQGKQGRKDWQEERKLNAETFGVTGGRGRGFRGGYRGGYNRGRGRRGGSADWR